MTADRTDAALAEIQRVIVNLGDTTSGGIFDRMTLTACAEIVGQMRNDCRRDMPPAATEEADRG